ncbi:methyltransferase domain-containing protein [candidate division GN15 bacterium]|nr:methyltransferase domain-containing protein [candidate division GN15 bacterium]
MVRLLLKPGIERRLKNVYLWIFNNQIERVEDLQNNGDLVEIISSKGRPVGIGYFNRHSLIAVRVLSFQSETIDQAFFHQRISRAIERRARLSPNATSGRIVFSEADLLPGLIVDRFGPYLSVQLLTLGMERLWPIIEPVLVELLRPEAIVLRNDSPAREREGLDRKVEIAHGEVPDVVEIDEYGLKFGVDMRGGQKTGFFFDQRDNRRICRNLAANGRVLDCFSYTGGFALNAARGGAVSVLAVDESDEALQLLERNAARNNLDGITTRRADCFVLLRELQKSGERFDLIILDPPAFVKSKEKLREAVRGYKEINLSAMKLLSPGGILISCSCSYQLSPVEFLNMITSAARDARRLCHLREFTTQAPDHPVLLTMPETQYLKCAVLEMID